MAFRRLHQAFKHLRFPSATNPFASSRRRARRSPVSRAQGRYDLEHLESRTLLTTVSGTIDANGNVKEGDVFEFRSSAGAEQVIRVKLQGRVTVELIGAQVNRRSNDIQLVNLPGLLNGEPIGGGIRTGIGIQPIGPLLVNPVAAPTPPIFNPNVSALAADNNGNIYGIHSGPAQIIDPNTGALVQGTAVQIVQLTLP